MPDTARVASAIGGICAVTTGVVTVSSFPALAMLSILFGGYLGYLAVDGDCGSHCP